VWGVWCVVWGVELGVWGLGEEEIQTPMAQGRSTKTISMIQWIRTSRLSISDSLSLWGVGLRGRAWPLAAPAFFFFFFFPPPPTGHDTGRVSASNRPFQVLDLHWRSPDSAAGGTDQGSRKRRFAPALRAGWGHGSRQTRQYTSPHDFSN